jgi:hypothetical protein
MYTIHFKHSFVAPLASVHIMTYKRLHRQKDSDTLRRSPS